jgi:uncharacterized membrane protein
MDERIARTSKDMVDVAELGKRTWALFQVKPIEHIVAALIVLALSAVTLGVLLGPLTVGQIRMIEKQLRGEEPRIEDVFGGFDTFGPALLTTLVFVVALVIGLALLLLPGLFVCVAWGFALWFVALQGASTTDALASSWQLLKAHTGSVVVILLVVTVVNAVASSVLFATLLSAPLTMIFSTLAFQEMQNKDRGRIMP